ncbi:MAG: hypothetical protein ACM3X1_04815 [Ignavibacteriales bacterium]
MFINKRTSLRRGLFVVPKIKGEDAMKIIKGHVDVELLKEENSLPQAFVEFLENEWMELYEAYSDGESLEEFSLELHGMQIVFEKGDRLAEGFGEVIFPEYVEKIRFKDIELYRMYVMEAEDYGKLYYSIVGTLDDASEAFLQEYAEGNER